MDLDRRQAELRSRGSFEAIDLGFAMTRRWAGPVWTAWMVGVAPPMAALLLFSFLLPRWAVLLCAVLVWWLKPLYERVPLFVLSRALFGATPGAGEVLRALPGLYWHRMLAALTLYRGDPARVFLVPVSLLERLTGRARSRRRTVLSRGQWGAAIWLTLACSLIEWVVFGGLVGMVLMLLPDAPQWHPLTLIERPWALSALLGLWMVATSLVTPFYAGGGFGLYINRRTELEGWDVELVFRSLAQRLQVPSIAALALLLALWPSAASADTGLSVEDIVEELTEEAEEEPALPPEVPFELDRSEGARARSTLDEVLQDETFGHTEEKPVWVLQEAWAQRLEEVWPDGCVEEPQAAPDSALSPIVAAILEVLFWALGAVAVVALAVVLLRTRFVRDLSVEVELPEPVSGESGDLAARRRMVPSLADKARALLAQGDVEGALGLLYRGSVLHLVEVQGLEIEEGATEGEVLRIVRRRARPLGDYFRGLTGAWLEVAYAHRSVEAGRVSELIDEWPRHFGAA